MEENKKEQLLAAVIEYEKKAGVKKRYTTVVVTVLFVLLALVYFYLRLFNTTFEITGYNSDRTRARVDVKYSTAWYIKYPAEIDGQVITDAGTIDGATAPHVVWIDFEEGILDSALMMGLDTLIKVRYPSTIEFVHRIWYCDNLTFVTFEETSQRVYFVDGVFMGTAIREIELPQGASHLEYTFSNCKYLKKVVLPNDMPIIGEGVFYGCEDLRQVEWPENLEIIEKDALEESGLWDCTIEELNLPETVTFANTRDDILGEEVKE